MTPDRPEPLAISVAERLGVSALFIRPAHAWTCYVLAYGAGAGMSHTFLEAVAPELADLGVATLGPAS
jgi:predicted alpha/beta-hydrolase family hydrolase